MPEARLKTYHKLLGTDLKSWVFLGSGVPCDAPQTKNTQNSIPVPANFWCFGSASRLWAIGNTLVLVPASWSLNRRLLAGFGVL